MLTRRRFVQSAGAAAALSWPLVHATGQNEPTLKVGIVGCGGRGRGALENVLDAAPNVQVIAMADMFKDRLDGTRKTLAGKPGFKVDDDHCFIGWDASRKVLESGVDYVMLTEPPGFRPPHFEEAIAAGKHVFFEKPVAVDPAGVRRVIAAGEKAKAKKLGVIPGTQSRHSAHLKEWVRRIHDGQIGEIVAGRIYFNTGFLWYHEPKPEWTEIEVQIRNWYYYDWLSGDHIVEQHVHQHDLTNWVLGATPVAATAVGGRQVRTEPKWGNIWDHFCVDYEYPNDVRVMSLCRQWDGCPGQTGAVFTGTRGTASLLSNRVCEITGEKPWRAEQIDNRGQVWEHKDLIESIRAGRPINEAERIALSSLTSILGREAAYTGQRILFDDLLKKSTQDLAPAKYAPGPNPMRPVPVPGRYRHPFAGGPSPRRRNT